MNLTCGNCGYDVRGLPTTVCPECGKDYTLFRLRPPPRMIVLRLAAATPLFLAIAAAVPAIPSFAPMTRCLGGGFLICVVMFAFATARRIGQSFPRNERSRTIAHVFCWLLLLGLLVNTALTGVVLLAFALVLEF